ncbi:MAG: deoxyribose-phosphate aldolase [Putridiphycobacter sp.]|nr:deoxyribose-phosphate aldolase [Putridiphycobacter sp.]
MISKKDVIPLIDLTSLNTTDSATTIHKLIQLANSGHEGTHPASVCVYPKFAKQIKQNINKPIQTCVVSTYFPSSQAPLELKLAEINYLNTVDIDEIDIVLPIGEFLANNYKYIDTELNAIRGATSKKLKLIIETGLLLEPKHVEKATLMGIESGMNFIKTSTGKTTIGADIESVKVMAKTIKYSGAHVGLKIAGGIKTHTSALSYIETCAAILGDSFINPSSFRIGASSLYSELIANENG